MDAMKRLLIRPGAIGDFILSLPALEALRTDYTEIWCAEQNVPLAKCADAARSIVSAGLDRLGLLPADDVVDRLRKFDSIVSWYGANRPDFRELVSSLSLPFTFLPALPPNGGRHAIEFYNSQAFGIAGKRASRFPRIAVPAQKREFAVIHPFASSVRKRAPMAVFECMAAQLESRMPIRWLCGPEENLESATRIADLYDLAMFLRGARVYVGNDSGITHLAAAVGTPVMALFRESDPRVWAPRGVSSDVLFAVTAPGLRCRAVPEA